MRRRRFLALAAALALGPLACARRDDGAAVATDRPADTKAASDPTRSPGTDGPDPDPVPDPRAERSEGAVGETAPDPDADDSEPPADDGEAPAAHDVDPDAYPTSASQWGEHVDGVADRLATDEAVVALTFDACGGPGGDGYDEALIAYLIDEQVPATLFFNARWVRANEGAFERLAANPLFEVANHGTEHRPLSVDGRSAYGIAGTADPGGVVEEVMTCQRLLERRTGRWPRHFRSGTAHYDEVAVRIVGDLGLRVAGFDVLGDAGATFNASQVAAALASAGPGSIALLHMNQPASGTAEGVRRAVPLLRERGLRLSTLDAHGVA